MRKLSLLLLTGLLVFGSSFAAFAAGSADAAKSLASLRGQVDLSGLDKGETGEVFPEKLDLREQGYVTPVKLQSPFGTCWGFSAIAAAETSILSEMGKTYDETGLDLSEHQLTYFARKPLADGSDQEGEGHYLLDESIGYLNTGGLMATATSALSSGIGVVSESLVPYRGEKGIVDMKFIFPLSYSAKDNWDVAEDYRFLQTYELEDANMLPEPALKKWNNLYTEYEYLGYDPGATEAMKSELMQGRAVAIAYCTDPWKHGKQGEEQQYISDSYSHYTYDSGVPNHAVTVVGWDDTYSKDNFLKDHQPPADGAWIVKNSWGAETEELHNAEAWGIPDENGKASGYFYISYYDHSLSTPVTLNFDVNARQKACVIDQYDHMTDDSAVAEGWFSENELKMANIYTAGYDQKIRHISTRVTAAGEDVTFEIYLLNDDYKTPVDGSLVISRTERFGYAGVHRTALSEPVEVKQGQSYAVVVTQSVNAKEAGYGRLYEVNASRAFTESGLRNYNEKVKEDYQERAYGKAIVNEGESWLYSLGEWNDWSGVLEKLAKDSYYRDYTIDNFPVKVYAELDDEALAESLFNKTTQCCYPDPELSVEDYMTRAIIKYLVIGLVILAAVIGLVVAVVKFITGNKCRWKKRTIKILFVGNSHTYYNEMPSMVKELARKKKRKVEVAMVAHAGRYLKEHLSDPGKEAEFNIRHGDFEYVVLQEHTHPFEEAEPYFDSIRKFCQIVRESYGVPVIYETWAAKGDGDAQPPIEALCEKAAKENGALLAEVGKKWWESIKKHPEKDLYFTDGKHANEKGSKLAAEVIWEVIREDSRSDRRWNEKKKDDKRRKKDAKKRK